ncbi:hypothetical protein CCZ01_06185 [Helicobacter monodelphidis]|uniref:hypothetical protein n=1 Tax=Helicobacter sp. 15-1451 TaxID=2004995 RepID=UPI000DCC4595|nr:hypothetical protein [Helicobacter sp. 15-1451]RAX57423.1 hypothetical protein CCZ01_06185 [Helicobacter sp. 15-1451]
MEQAIEQNTDVKREEKEQLLQEYDRYQEESNNLNLKSLITIFILLFLILALFAPKIYIRSNIYYASRNILHLQTQADALREENKHLKKQLEDVKFKYLILDMGD